VTTLEGEVNRFLHRHPNVGALVVFGSFVGIVVLGGKFVDYVAENAAVLALIIAIAVLMVVAFSGKRDPS
jgi:hypothetical protein